LIYIGPVNAREALGIIRRLAGEGLVLITTHAEAEMDDLDVVFDDILHALFHAKTCRWQPEHETWKVKGPDRLRVTLVLAVDIQESVVVVTVFD
jgi:hypothetical protein